MNELQSNNYYYDLRSHYSYHENAVKDYVFMNALKDAIGLNSSEFEDRVILELGSGTGIFSMLIARAGAKHVYAWEPSSISEISKEIIKANKLDNIITVLNCPIADIKIPGKVDVVFTSAFGISFYLDSFLPQFLFARDNYLKENGILLPQLAEFSLSTAIKSRYGRPESFWDDVYGFDFTPIKDNSFNEPYMYFVSPQMIKSEISIFQPLDFNTLSINNLNVKHSFTIKCNEEHEVSSFVFWFKVIFNNNVIFDTSPYKDQTHFCQIIFDIKEPFQVKEGDIISGTISINLNDNKTRPIFYKIKYTINKSEEIKQIFVLQ